MTCRELIAALQALKDGDLDKPVKMMVQVDDFEYFGEVERVYKFDETKDEDTLPALWDIPENINEFEDVILIG